jgi:hypothetical protein
LGLLALKIPDSLVESRHFVCFPHLRMHVVSMPPKSIRVLVVRPTINTELWIATERRLAVITAPGSVSFLERRKDLLTGYVRVI